MKDKGTLGQRIGHLLLHGPAYDTPGMEVKHCRRIMSHMMRCFSDIFR